MNALLGNAARSEASLGAALVTGATGFIASHLIPALVAAGWRVRACGRRPRPAWLPGAVDYRSVDLAGSDPLDDLLEDVTHLFHLAGASSSLSSEDEMHRSNVVATENLLSAAHSAGLDAALYVSSTSIYGEEVQLAQPVPEDVEPHPSRGYGKAKWEAEQVVWRFADKGLRVWILRPVTVFGPGNVKLLGSAVLDAAIERFAGLSTLAVHSLPIEQRLVHIADVVSACIHLVSAGAPEGRAYNLTLPEYPSSHQIADIIAGQLGLRLELSDDVECGLGYDERKRVRERMLAAGMTDDILLSTERFRFMRKSNRNNRLSIDALLSTGYAFRERDIAAAITHTIDWYRAHRWIV